ncbi:hypothetical protein [Dyadobacter sp. MSC1_007]|jgi:hypothetical protein|uniref:hypothetical protein n=1 Tax=Dyadobacter sp. MSC1_007 TaxID=2909264 RepID=UPI00202F7844|nr:hypothetical protein [Dyadobacter sp. MSC1_007]
MKEIEPLWTYNEILHFSPAQALRERMRYENALKAATISGSSNNKTITKTLDECIFLMTVIINGELEPNAQLEDLLEDYYDGLLVEKLKSEERIPWEDVKAELDAKHKLI